MQFSANLGFLFRDLALPDAIQAAKRHGFAAVELHWPYDTDASSRRLAVFCVIELRRGAAASGITQGTLLGGTSAGVARPRD